MLHSSVQMASYEGKGLMVVNKFNGVNFYLQKLKMEIVMANKKLWKIINISKESSSSLSNPSAI